MRNRQIVKVLFLVILCTSFVFGFSLFGAKAFETVMANNDRFTENTAIGPVDVSNLKYDEALSRLQKAQNDWIDATTINLQYKEKTIELSGESFIFSLEKSVNNAESEKQNELFVSIEEERIDSILLDFNIPADNFNREVFKQEILSFPSMMEKGVHTVKLDNFLIEQPENQVISESSVLIQNNSEQFDLWVQEFSTITIKPHSQFSMLNAIEEKGINTFTSEGLSVVATAIYKTVLSTNFSIIERSISRELPVYAESGFEAKVDKEKNMDLIFANPNNYEYILEFKKEGNLFQVSLVGPQYLYQYHVAQKDKQTFNPKKILQYDAKLASGEQKIKSQGRSGLLIKLYRETIDENGVTLNNELIAEDFYPPIHTVVVSGLYSTPEAAEAISDDAQENTGNNNADATGSAVKNNTQSTSNSTENACEEENTTTVNETKTENQSNNNAPNNCGETK